MAQKILKVHPSDNVIVALTDLKKGDQVTLDNIDYELVDNVQQKHKFATQDFNVGDIVTMYGVPVGKASQPIKKGGVVTTENLKHYSSDFSVKERNTSWTKPDISRFEGRTFNGYHRKDGKVGTANFWLVIPLVFCENRNINMIKDAMVKELGYSVGKKYDLNVKSLVEKYKNGSAVNEILEEEIIMTAEESKKNRIFPNVDGIKFLTHEGGCGGTRMDSDTLCNLLAGYITNPNVAGATVLSLGCQNAQPEILQNAIKERDPNFEKPLYILEQQKSQSEPELIAEAVKKTFVGLIQANEITRQPAPLSKLVIGLECGGSDGFSGISANPAVGHVSDLTVALGGTSILSEFPELCGVEQELSDRCVTDELADKFNTLMKTYNERAVASGSGFDANPSPGNIKDGLITDAIKSAGAAKKGGTSPIIDVLDYTEPAVKNGLNLLCTPGNDVESTTGLAGSWANIILFTTGLGTPTGNPVTPTIKISSNTHLSQRMSDIIDVNAGTVISGEDTIESKGEEMLEYIIAVASGEKMPNAMKLAQDDFIPWKRGVSL
ncbi:UxaA family hydrolase [Flexithrix dorotheae]|uniref:UxaA family hydrolase n=1 Tax=Flexithrix dorotheae TaxID=70993 RepID=UPI00037BF26F|nr:altronate dehydratase family protein [Flexithrix dorotheae]